MSFGDQNNPYGQQQPAQPAQPGYGYPAAPPVQQGYGAGYPAAPMEMPSSVKTGRILVWVIIALQIVFAVYALTQLGEIDKAVEGSGLNSNETEAIADIGKGVVVFFAGFAVVFALLGLFIGLKYTSGGNGVRVCAIVWASFAIVGGLFQLPIGIGTIIAAILLIVFAAKGDSAAWFKRPRV
ncbi:hypothetical protein [Streptomyces sp. TRM64462]|uniref:hypothetical protein n=1 Tax=Streptomyces sp. TRM64462 TaxID=2741726 RepID=UPI001586B1F2|nr:hypothetical protein [Streptomyces sp. TRM64462]